MKDPVESDGADEEMKEGLINHALSEVAQVVKDELFF